MTSMINFTKLILIECKYILIGLCLFIKSIFCDMYDYIQTLMCLEIIKGSLLFTLLNYLLFPNEYFKIALTAIAISIIIDLVTKIYQISYCSNGFFKACVKDKTIKSDKLLYPTLRKIFVYLIVFIFAGQAYRLSTTINYQDIVMFPIILFFSLIFIREFYSSFENLRDSGADVGWILNIININKKKIENKLTDNICEKEDKKD